MVSSILLVALLAFQPQGTGESGASSILDDLVRHIPGFNPEKEPKPIGDEAFLMRLLKDVLGAVPTPAEAKAFVDDPDPAKRSAMIGKVVEDPRFAPFWAERFARVFFGDPEKLCFTGLEDRPPGLEGRVVAKFTEFLAGRLKKDEPWTRIVHDLLTARGTTEGDPALAYLLSFYRGEGLSAEFPSGVARHFLGIRLDCARCHDHPYDRWTVDNFYSLGAFAVRQKVRRVKDEIELKYAAEGEISIPTVRASKAGNVKAAGGGTVGPNFLFGGTGATADDRMKVLATCLTATSDPQFTRAWVNRIWGWFFGYGVLDPVDDFNLRNKAIYPALLEALAKDTREQNHSLKRLIRVITGTVAYQLPTPEEEPLLSTFRHLAKSRKEQASSGVPSIPPPTTYQVPGGWTRQRPRLGARDLFLIPSPTDKTRAIEFALFGGAVGPMVLSPLKNQMLDMKVLLKDSVIEGKITVRLTELSGTYPCDPRLDGPTECVVLLAAFEAPDGKPYHFRLQGPSALVGACREEVLTLLKSIGK